MEQVSVVLVVQAVAVSVLPIAFAHDDHEVTHAPLDVAIIHVDTISRETPMRVREFDTDTAHLGTTKHRSQAEDMEAVAPGRLAKEILNGLKANGFKDIAITKNGDELPASYLVIDGHFTVLNPGSATKRVLWGFGAGKTQAASP